MIYDVIFTYDGDSKSSVFNYPSRINIKADSPADIVNKINDRYNFARILKIAPTKQTHTI